MRFAPIPEAVDRLASGQMVVVVDGPDRENEGDLTMAAARVTAEAINFMLTFAKGLVCMPCQPSRLDELDLHPMVTSNTSAHETAFTVSVDHRTAGSGISAADRATTIRRILDPESVAGDFMRPGHVFPLRARAGGVVERAGHTEAAVELAAMSGLGASGVICEVLNRDGTVARLPDLTDFAAVHGLVVVSIEDLIAHRARTANGAGSNGSARRAAGAPSRSGAGG
ncbi:MAG TPA: 3,4-dihydroxy-2-butanone-4-phosphate synthase [Actinomycetota bacterium]|nr:3,4-dihydroxy-2-butanone-4-phosphate synthase [Actinomycetota bacterium]